MQPTTDNSGAEQPRVYWARRGILFPLFAALAACSTAPSDRALDDLRGTVRGDTGGRPAALINDEPLTWEQLQPALAEAAGGMVLQEAALDRLVGAEYFLRLGKHPGEISNERLAAERAYFTDAIRRAAGAGPDQAAVLAAGIREARGLGDSRFTALLKRNAMLRELVAPSVSITPELVQQRFDVRFGPRYRARIITTANEADAGAALTELLGGERDLAARFSALAFRVSTDESRQRGGTIEPISPADPAYSPALRTALARLGPGQLTGVLSLDPGFGIALLEEVMPGEPATLDEHRADIEDELRRRQERVLMDTLAGGLLQSARIVPMDRSLGWSWKHRSSEPRP